MIGVSAQVEEHQVRQPERAIPRMRRRDRMAISAHCLAPHEPGVLDVVHDLEDRHADSTLCREEHDAGKPGGQPGRNAHQDPESARLD